MGEYAEREDKCGKNVFHGESYREQELYMCKYVSVWLIGWGLYQVKYSRGYSIFTCMELPCTLISRGIELVVAFITPKSRITTVLVVHTNDFMPGHGCVYCVNICTCRS